MNLHISDPSQTRISLTLLPTEESNLLAAGLQFKQHPHVAKFDMRASRTEAKEIKLRDATRTFPMNQNLAVLKWRYKGNDEGAVPLSSMFHLSLFKPCLIKGCVSKLLADAFKRRHL